MASPAVQQDGRVRRRILVQGVVQGVGFRPFVYSTATELLLTGSVSNSPPASSSRSRAQHPPSPRSSAGSSSSRRRWPSSRRSTRSTCGPAAARVSPSARPRPGRPAARWRHRTSPRARDCLRELADPADRRYRHPFITCTELRPALHHHRRRCPTTGRRRRWPASRCAPACAARVRRPRRPPLPRPADRLPRLRAHARAGRREWRDAPGGEAALAGARTPPGRRRGRSRSRASAATTSPATPPTSRRWPSCAGASGAATSRSR